MNIQRDKGLDTLKSISITFVLILHLHPIIFIGQNDDNIINFLNSLVKTLELQVARTAVPTFFIVSLYLFFLKNPNTDYLKKRLTNLCKIFSFWTAVQLIFATIVNGKLPDFSWKIIIGVDPSLPLVSDSVLYFLFNLIILSILAFLYQNINSYNRVLVSYGIVISSALFFELFGLLKLHNPYYFIGNFIIYIPIAFALVNYKDQILRLKLYYLIAYIMFSVHDVILRQSNSNLEYYGRLSIVFGTLTLFCFIYPLSIKDNFYILNLSKYSLGLFTIHKYWQYIFIWLTNIYAVSLPKGIPFDIISLVLSILVVLFTSITIKLLSLTKIKQFVS